MMLAIDRLHMVADLEAHDPAIAALAQQQPAFGDADAIEAQELLIEPPRRDQVTAGDRAVRQDGRLVVRRDALVRTGRRGFGRIRRSSFATLLKSSSRIILADRVAGTPGRRPGLAEIVEMAGNPLDVEADRAAAGEFEIKRRAFGAERQQHQDAVLVGGREAAPLEACDGIDAEARERALEAAPAPPPPAPSGSGWRRGRSAARRAATPSPSPARARPAARSTAPPNRPHRPPAA